MLTWNSAALIPEKQHCTYACIEVSSYSRNLERANNILLFFFFFLQKKFTDALVNLGKQMHDSWADTLVCVSLPTGATWSQGGGGGGVAAVHTLV